MFEVGTKVYWEDPDDGISSGEYWIVGKNGEILYLKSNDGSECEALSDECTIIIQ